MGHKFWGKVNENWIGFLSDVKFKTPYLKKEEIEIYLGRDTSIPSEQEMDDYEKTFRSFLDNIEVVISEIKKKPLLDIKIFTQNIMRIFIDQEKNLLILIQRISILNMYKIFYI
jgi:hypothetical protein